VELSYETTTDATGDKGQDIKGQQGKRCWTKTPPMDNRTRSGDEEIEKEMVGGEMPSQILASTMDVVMGSVQGPNT